MAAAVPGVPAGRWLRGFGWTADGWEPSRAALDAVSGDVPVALLAHDWHSLWLNSAALAHAGGDLEVPGGVVELEAGVLREEAAWSFRDRFTRASHAELVEATRAALPVAAARGVTAIHDKDGVIGSRDVFAELRDELPFRVWQSLPAEPARRAAGLRQGVHGRHARLAHRAAARRQRRGDHEPRGVRGDHPRRRARERARRRARDRRPRQPRRARRVRGHARGVGTARPAPADRARPVPAARRTSRGSRRSASPRRSSRRWP